MPIVYLNENITKVTVHASLPATRISHPDQGQGGGGGLGPNYGSVCPKVRTWVLLQPHESEISENSSLKMGVKFAVSLNMGDNVYVIVCN